MLKAVIVCYRRPDLDQEQFRAYWKDVHGPIVAKIPGLRRYVQQHALPMPGSPAPAIGGVAEMHFDGPDAMQTALASPEAQAAFADVPNFLDAPRIGMVVVEDHVVI